MKKERIEYFDISKGIAILLVILGHCLYFSIYKHPSISKNGIMSIITSIHMPVFIFISGVFSKNIGVLKSFWIKKLKQLLLPLIFIPILYCLVVSMDFSNLIYNGSHGGF